MTVNSSVRWSAGASIALVGLVLMACSKLAGEGQNLDSSRAIERAAVVGAPVGEADTSDPGLSRATFSSGCFWCVEGVFESVEGVRDAVSGYTGGDEANPTYEQVSSGTTGHVEAVNVYYDSTVVDYPTLVRVFFESQDPTQVDGQGPDRGKQYRSVAFYRNEGEKAVIASIMDSLNRSGAYAAPIAVQFAPFKKFWPAEEYHQNFVEKNPNHPYVQGESMPRISRFKQQCPLLLKPKRAGS